MDVKPDAGEYALSMDDSNKAANEDVMDNIQRSSYVNCDFDCTEVFVKRSRACLFVIRHRTPNGLFHDLTM